MTTKTKSAIIAIEVRRMIDDSPDTSFLGEYTEDYSQSDLDAGKVIDRKIYGDMGLHGYRYFVAAMSGDDTGNPESVNQDYQRMESLNRGDWSFIGIRAVAKVQFSESSVIQTITSGGLWGIESDSDDNYLQSVAREELAQLTDDLKAAGFSARQIKQAMPIGEVEFID